MVIAATGGGRPPHARPSGSVTREMVPGGSAGPAGPAQQESRAWIARLGTDGRERDAAIADLHALLVRAARFEVGRRRASFPQLRGGDHEDLAQQSADDALLAILAKLGDFRGDSRFTTWAYKFVLYEAAAKVRRRAWQGREVPLEAEGWPCSRSPLGPARRRRDGRPAPRAAGRHRDELTPHQREVLVALALNEVPIDVLADRLSTTRGALYKTLHDARRKLRAAIAARGLDRDGHDGRTAG